MMGVTYATESEAIAAWNTRAAPTMKPWVWSDRPTSEYITKLTESTYCAMVTTRWVGFWDASIGNADLGRHATCELAQAACVAYVERKLKEWLLP